MKNNLWLLRFHLTEIYLFQEEKDSPFHEGSGAPKQV